MPLLLCHAYAQDCIQSFGCQSERPLLPNVFPTDYPDDLLQAALASFSAGAEGPGSEQLARVEQARHSSSLGVDDDDIDEDEVGSSKLRLVLFSSLCPSRT